MREMAALPAGVQYGLSSEPGGKENKELVFVKLTDSALKAIEDFIRNNRVSGRRERTNLIRYADVGRPLGAHSLSVYRQPDTRYEPAGLSRSPRTSSSMEK